MRGIRGIRFHPILVILATYMVDRDEGMTFSTSFFIHLLSWVVVMWHDNALNDVRGEDATDGHRGEDGAREETSDRRDRDGRGP